MLAMLAPDETRSQTMFEAAVAGPYTLAHEIYIQTTIYHNFRGSSHPAIFAGPVIDSIENSQDARVANSPIQIPPLK